MNRLVRITTAARLHFGLLDVASPFGGCGVMIDRPETIVESKPATEFRCVAPKSVPRSRSADHLERAKAIATFLAVGGSLPKVEVRIVQAAPSHNGLGSGTQLSLAIAESIVLAEMPVVPADEIEQLGERSRLIAAANRGLRSAVGTHGYFRGGFLAEGLSPDNSPALNTLDKRLVMPASWRAVVLLPKTTSAGETVSGSEEQAKFDQLATTASQREQLRVQLVDEIIPSIQSGDFASFSDAVTRYNRSSGELFASVQGGPYNGVATTALIESLLDAGQQGVGQSSWGPGVFVWFPTPQSAWSFAQQWDDKHRDALIVAPKLAGRTVQLS